MKKMLSMLLALTVAAAGVFSVFPVMCSADDYGTTVTATIEPSSSSPIKVDITWSSMEFTYSDGGWDAATHSYKGEGWTTDGGEITAENNGTVAVSAVFSYIPTDGFPNITGYFSNYTLDLDVGEKGTTVLSLSGKPTQALKNELVGLVAITITVLQP